MENQEELNIGIGTREAKTLKPAEVEVQGVKIDVKKNRDEKEVGKLITLLCKHPDKDELINLSQVKGLRNDKVKLSSLWLNLDEDNLLCKNSATSMLLNFANVPTFGELVGKKLPTIEQKEDSAFLCIKAY